MDEGIEGEETSTSGRRMPVVIVKCLIVTVTSRGSRISVLCQTHRFGWDVGFAVLVRYDLETDWTVR